MQDDASFPSPWIIVGFVVGSALVASVAPLATYAISLAALGLVHVLSEVRYVDERFRLRLGQGLVAGVLGLLVVIVGWRIWLAFGGTVGEATPSVELLLVLLLALTALVAVRHAGVAASLAATCVVVLLAIGAYTAPLTALVILAVLHNLTPIGFLAERLRGPQRRRVLVACVVIFVAVPVVIGSGFLATLWNSVGLSFGEAAVWRVGELHEHIGVFIPPSLQVSGAAVHLFAAAVYLQVMHYGAVIHILPRLGAGELGESSTMWPARPAFALFLGVVAAVSLVGFAFSFTDARRIYGIFAAFHAWMEVPILLLAIGGGAVLRQRVAA